MNSLDETVSGAGTPHALLVDSAADHFGSDWSHSGHVPEAVNRSRGAEADVSFRKLFVWVG